MHKSTLFILHVQKRRRFTRRSIVIIGLELWTTTWDHNQRKQQLTWYYVWTKQTSALRKLLSVTEAGNWHFYDGWFPLSSKHNSPLKKFLPKSDLQMLQRSAFNKKHLLSINKEWICFCTTTSLDEDICVTQYLTEFLINCIKWWKSVPFQSNSAVDDDLIYFVEIRNCCRMTRL